MNTTSKPSDISFSKLGSSIEEPVIISLMTSALSRPDLISLAAGFTDNDKLPKSLIENALSGLNKGGSSEYLQYGTNQGRPLLRELITQHLAGLKNEKSERFSADNLAVTNGSQQALYLAMQVLCNRDDIILVEGPSYFVYLEMLRGLGVNAVSMPMLDNGCLDLPKLKTYLEEAKKTGKIDKIKAIYLVSYYSNPAGHSMPLSDKKGLAQILKELELNMPILEDAAYRELWHKEPHEAPSVISLPEFDSFPCLYLGTFSKCFCSGLKLGYAYCNRPDWLEKMLRVKGHHDFGSSNTNQAVMEKILKDGDFARWVDSLHSHYGRKAEIFEAVAAEHKIKDLGWTWERLEGGLMAWVKGPESVDTSIGSDFHNKALDNGVFYVPGDLCFAEREPKNCMRLSVGTPAADVLKEGLNRLFRTMHQV